MIVFICFAVIILLLLLSKQSQSYFKVAKGVKYVNLNQYEKAMNCFDYALKINNKCIIAYHNKVCLLIKEDKMDEALKNCLKIIEIKPESYDSYTRIKLYYLKLNDYDSILKYSAEAHSTNPSAVSLYLYRAYAYIHKKNYYRAIKSIERILNSDSSKIVQNTKLNNILKHCDYASGFYAVSAVMKLSQKKYDDVYNDLSKLPFDKYDYSDFLKCEIFKPLKEQDKFKNIVKECDNINAYSDLFEETTITLNKDKDKKTFLNMMCSCTDWTVCSSFPCNLIIG